MWFGVCDVKTGQLLGELPLVLGGELQCAMRTITTGTFSLPTTDPRCPKDWEQLTIPYRFWIIVCDGDSNIWWGGLIESRQRNGQSSVVNLSCVSPEDYLDRRYVPAKRFDQTDQTDIVKWMVEQATFQGVPFVTVGQASGRLRDREYHDDDADTIYKRLTELAEVIDGPEWYTGLAWQNEDRKNAVVPLVQVGNPRVGVHQARPQAVFELPGGLLEATLEERAKVGEFATLVVCAGGGEGEDRPMSSPQIDSGIEVAGWPRVEVRKTYDSVKKKTTLDSHASALLVSLKTGVQVWSVTQLSTAFPRLGVDWGMGDSVGLRVRAGTLNADRAFRVVGWTISATGQTITPHLADL